MTMPEWRKWMNERNIERDRADALEKQRDLLLASCQWALSFIEHLIPPDKCPNRQSDADGLAALKAAIAAATGVLAAGAAETGPGA